MVFTLNLILCYLERLTLRELNIKSLLGPLPREWYIYSDACQVVDFLLKAFIDALHYLEKT